MYNMLNTFFKLPHKNENLCVGLKETVEVNQHFPFLCVIFTFASAITHPSSHTHCVLIYRLTKGKQILPKTHVKGNISTRL